MKNTKIILGSIVILSVGILSGCQPTLTPSSSTTETTTTPSESSEYNGTTPTQSATPDTTQSTTTSTTTTTSSSGTQSSPVQTASNISIKNFSFTPSSPSLKAGTLVTWTNNDTALHTITSDDGLFSSQNLTTGQSYSYLFNTPGVYNYHCSIHPAMKASITIQN